MTNEETIEYLKWIRPKKPWSLDKKNAQTAIDKAINALEQQACEDCISRQAVLNILDNHTYSKEFCEEHHIDWSINLGMAHIVINDLPSVTSKQKTGHWVKITPYPLQMYDYECSECGHETDDNTENYCSECGARMVDPQESEG